MIAHDDLALQAMQRVAGSDTMTIFDNIEHPRHQSRPHVPGSVRAMASAADAAAVDAYKVEAVNGADAVLATSAGQAEALRSMGVTTPVTLLRNAQDSGSPTRKNIRVHAGVKRDEVLIVYLNNVYDGAGHVECIEAMADVDDSVHLAFLGLHRTDGPSPGALAKAAGIARVHELSAVPAAELIDYISSADAVVIPLSDAHENHRTCLPNRVFQAVAAELPIIAHANTEIGAFVEAHGLGTVVTGLEPAELAAAFDAAGTLRADREAALRSAQESFTWENEQQVLRDVARNSADGGVAFLLANKPIDRHTRTTRLCRTLVTVFDEVHVFAYSLPSEAMRIAGVRYHDVSQALGRAELRAESQRLEREGGQATSIS